MPGLSVKIEFATMWQDTRSRCSVICIWIKPKRRKAGRAVYGQEVVIVKVQVKVKELCSPSFQYQNN